MADVQKEEEAVKQILGNIEQPDTSKFGPPSYSEMGKGIADYVGGIPGRIEQDAERLRAAEKAESKPKEVPKQQYQPFRPEDMWGNTLGGNPAIDPATGEITPQAIKQTQDYERLLRQSVPSSQGAEIAAKGATDLANWFKTHDPSGDLARNLQGAEQKFQGELGEVRGSENKPGILDEYKKGEAAAKQFSGDLKALQAKYPELSESDLRKKYSGWYKAAIGTLQSLSGSNYNPIDEEIKGVREDYAREYKDIANKRDATMDEVKYATARYDAQLRLASDLKDSEVRMYTAKYNEAMTEPDRIKWEIARGEAIQKRDDYRAQIASNQAKIESMMTAYRYDLLNNPNMRVLGTSADGQPLYGELRPGANAKIVDEQLPVWQSGMGLVNQLDQVLQGKYPVKLSNTEKDALLQAVQMSNPVLANKVQFKAFTHFARWDNDAIARLVLDEWKAGFNAFRISNFRQPEVKPAILKMGAPYGATTKGKR